jgi:hypothetical protein
LQEAKKALDIKIKNNQNKPIKNNQTKELKMAVQKNHYR